MIKLIIWDLDDTLWQGTLADGDGVRLVAHRAELIRRLNAHGVLASICSKNDFGTAKAQLTDLGLWDEFVFPHIAFDPKGEAVATIIADMQLRAADILFVDDNPLNLEAARFLSPDLQTLDIRDPDADARLAAILTDQPASRNRLADYRSLERKKQDRRAAPAASDEDFLRACEIRACAPPMMANLDFLDRIVELINRSNQLNYTRSRVDRETLTRDIVDGYLENFCWSIFAWDRYGKHGLVGFVMIERASRRLKHFVFSCRVMHMGLERYALDRYADRVFPGIIVPEEWQERMAWPAAGWIEDLLYEDDATREMLQDVLGQQADTVTDRPLRVMCACQSGGLAHYSAFNASIEFDIFPRVFALADFVAAQEPVPAFAPYIVYGAGIDYKNEAWPAEQRPLIETGLYASAVMRLCDHWMQHGTQALILLPSETLPDDYYSLDISLLRTIRCNRVWQEAADIYPCITLLEVDQVCDAEEMVDVLHHRPAALQTISSLIDVWYEAVSSYDDDDGSEPLADAA